MTKADKMFKELGYIKEDYAYRWRFENNNYIEILFFDGTVHNNLWREGTMLKGGSALTLKVTLAIYEKMKELGWNEQ